MKKLYHCGLLFVFLSLSTSTVFGVLQCISLAGGTWQEDGGASGTIYYTFSQDISTGQISGYQRHAVCVSDWPITGHSNFDGTFDITGTNPSPSDPVCVAAWWVAHGTIRLPGCNHVDDHWNNSMGQQGDSQWDKPCDLPTGENITADGFGSAYPYRSIGLWLQILQSNDSQINFHGREISEQFPQDGTDECYFSGSALNQQFRPVAGQWNVGQVDGLDDPRFNIWGHDAVGWDEIAADYYQVERPSRGLAMPCYFTVTQQMRIRCTSSSTPSYTQGDLRMGIDVTGVSSSRHGRGQDREWPPR